MGLESERFRVLLPTLVACAHSMNVPDLGLSSNKVEILIFLAFNTPFKNPSI